MPGVIQTLRVELDKADVAKAKDQINAVADALTTSLQGSIEKLDGNEAGKKVAASTIAGLRKGFDADMDALNLQFQRGLLEPKDFERKATGAAQRYTNALNFEMKRLSEDPSFTTNPFKGIEADAATTGTRTGTAFEEAIEAITSGRPLPAPDPAPAIAAGADAGTQVGEALAQGVQGSAAPQAASDKAIETAQAFVAAIEAETKAQGDRIKLAQEEGFLTPEEARAKGRETAEEHNKALLKGVADLRAAGTLTPQLLSVFTDSFRQIEDKVPPLSFFERVKKRIGTQLVGIGASLAGFFAAREVFRFAENSIGEFVADDKALQGIRNQINATGADYDKFADRISTVQKRLVGLGAASASQTALGISKLISVSHDADKSISNIGIAADFAAKHSLTFEQANELLARAMVGQTRGLNIYGISVKRGDDAVLAMAKDSAGFASKQGPNLTRSLAQLSFAWSDLKSGIGQALVEAGGGISTLDLLTTTIRDGSEWVKAHRGEIQAWGGALLQVFRATMKEVVLPILDGFTKSVMLGKAFIDVLIASYNDLERSLLRISAAYWDARAALDEFSGLGDLAKKEREVAQAYRDQADAINEMAKARRADAAAEVDRLKAFQKAQGGTSPARGNQTQAGGGSGAIPSTSAVEAPGGAVRPVGFGTPDPTNDALDKRIALLNAATKFEATRDQALDELARIEKTVEKQLTNTNLAIEKKIDLEQKLAAIQDNRLDLMKPLDANTAPQKLDPILGVRTGEVTPGEQAMHDAEAATGHPTTIGPVSKAEIEVAATLTPEEQKTFKGEVEQMLQSLGDEAAQDVPSFGDDLIETFFSNLDTFAEASAANIGDLFSDTFGDLLSDAQNVGQALGNLGKGMAKSLLKEISAMAKGKALENIAIAIEETAKGFAALASFNPAAAHLHFQAAGTAALAAVKWGLVAGSTGAMAGSAAGGGGGGSGNDRDNEAKDPLAKGRTTVYFNIRGGLLNTDDHVQMDQLAKAIAAVSDKDVVVSRG